MSKRQAEVDKELIMKKVRLAFQHTKEKEYEHRIVAQKTATEIGLSDVLYLEHAVNNLQTALKTVLERALDSEQLEAFKKEAFEDKDKANPEVVMALMRSKLTLAAHLQTLYKDDKLPIFDQIIGFEQFTSKQLAIKDKLEIDIGQEIVANSKDTTPIGRREDGMPELPEIRNPAIRARVFVHKSLVKDKMFISESEVIHAHNERLEFIGDSVLNNIMSLIIYNAFPNASEGDMSQLRARLISNVNLQRWSQSYGLHKELKMNTDDSIFKGKLKIYADVFEAYVGGLITEDPANYSKVFKWLEALAEPIIQGKEDFDQDGKTIVFGDDDEALNSAIRDMTDNEINTSAKVQLYSLIGYAGLGLHYDTVDRVVNKELTQFTVQVKTADDEVLGTGVGKNTKEAGYRAAMDALENKEIIEKFSQKRAAIPRGESKQSTGVKASRAKSVSNVPEKEKEKHESPKLKEEWRRNAEGIWEKVGAAPPSTAPAEQVPVPVNPPVEEPVRPKTEQKLRVTPPAVSATTTAIRPRTTDIRPKRPWNPDSQRRDSRDARDSRDPTRGARDTRKPRERVYDRYVPESRKSSDSHRR